MQMNFLPTLSSALAYLQTSQVTVLQENRRHHVRRFSAVLPISAMNLQPRDTEATVLTGVFYLSQLIRKKNLNIVKAIMYLFPISVQK